MTLDLADPIAVLLAAADALAKSGIECAAYGGLALAAYGTPRETRDADLAVVSAPGAEAVAALSHAGIESLTAFDRVRFGGNRVTRLTLIPGVGDSDLNTVDLVEPLSPRYARDVLTRAYTGTLRGRSLRIVTPEDFVLIKLLSTRERDIDDASTVLAALGARIDDALLKTEVATLADEVSDHDIAARYRRVRGVSSPK
jgi:hypothetical protein